MPLNRRQSAARALEEMERCEHPAAWRQPTRGLVGDGACQLCGASAETIARQAAERRQEEP